MKEQHVKRVFIDHFNEDQIFNSELVSFRQYHPVNDSIIYNFSSEDWENIFPGVDEKEFNIWTKCDDRIVLSCINRERQELFGLLVITDSILSNKAICFHGGIWKHDQYTTLLAYEGLDKILQFLVDNEFDVYVTCNVSNIQADRLQRRFGFEEYDVKNGVSYKNLDIEKFRHCDILQHLQRCMALVNKDK